MRRRARPSDLLTSDPFESAIAAGLRYVDGCGPCIRRIRCGSGFRYVGPDGRTLRDPAELKRIRSLAIPPAWSNVWICPIGHGHIQAIGWDVKGRKQYRYHPLYREVRDQAKFSRMIAFGTALAVIRKRVEEDLKRRGLPREKVLATVVRLLETTYIRVGNAEYARDNESFGLTTLRNRHVQISGATLRFQFKGKSGQKHLLELTDRQLARIVQQCQDLPGYELFEYVDEDGQMRVVDSADVNQYLRSIAGQDFTAKDFRTWAGTVLSAAELVSIGPFRDARDQKKKIVTAVQRVAQKLGNRPAASRKYYIHPAIFEAYADGSLFETMREGARQQQAYNGQGLRPEEYSVMVIIARHLEKLTHGKQRAQRAA